MKYELRDSKYEVIVRHTAVMTAATHARLCNTAPQAPDSALRTSYIVIRTFKLRFNIHTGLCNLIMPTREIGYKLTNRLHIEQARIEKMLRERIFGLPNGGRRCENKGLIIFPARRALIAENGRGGILDTIATLYT